MREPPTVSRDTLRLILGLLARAGLGLPEASAPVPSLGDLPLRAHQQEAVRRLRPLLARDGGALLADDVGLGKTFVALALAREWPAACVIAPASLVPMWRDTVARTGASGRLPVHSLHAFSHGAAPGPRTARSAPELVIIDEAHHLRNPRTTRYARIAERCRGATVLLLSASPVHNRRADLAHLLALFLGTRAHALDDAERARLVVRRTADTLAGPAGPPAITAHAPITVPDAPSVTRALAHLPPPLPTRDGQAAGALIALGLVRAWCSSAAAARALVQTRRLRATALETILRDGRWPSRTELRTWSVGDDAVQLGFTALLVRERPADHAPVTDSAHRTLARHLDALDTLARCLRAVATPLDRARVEALRAIRAAHRTLPIVAFSQYTATVRALGELLRWEQGVATLTARGGRVAGGSLARRDLLARFAPRAHGVAEPAPHERIRLLLTTDLLAEGVNLQDAGVVVHLDLPWTPAAITQREGRIARLGSPHAAVHAYTLAPPGGGAALLAIAERLRRKAHVAFRVLSAGETAHDDATPSHASAPRSAAHTTRALVTPLRLPTRATTFARILAEWCALAPVQLGDAPLRPAPDRALLRLALLRLELRRAPAPDRALRTGRHGGWLAAVHEAAAGPGGGAATLYGGWFGPEQRRTRSSRDPRILSQLLRLVPGITDAIVAPRECSEAAVTRAEVVARRALARAERRRRTHQLVEVLHAPGPRAERTLRELLRTAPLGLRTRLAPAVARARAAVRSLRGVGDERALDALLAAAPARGAEPDLLLDWLAAVAGLGTAPDRPSDAAPLHASASDNAPTLRALLLLLP
jgi:superfamily II DNA or RNA helicase